MTRFGYTLMSEQSGPRELVQYGASAEDAGFDFLAVSDHFFPWLEEMGHSPFAWSVLGAVVQATERIGLMTYVTCPILRYHPAVVAQQAATVGVLSEGRFTLGLGSGENLNEHVVGDGWPMVAVRQDRLAEAIDVIRELFSGSQVSLAGEYYRVDQAKLYDVPDVPVPIAVAVSGPESLSQFAPLADHMIAVQPEADLVSGWEVNGGSPTAHKIGQVPICWHPDEDHAVEIAHRLFRWFGGGWPVNADLPTPAGFAAASQFVRPEDVAETIKCGPDLDHLAAGVQPYLDAGFTDVAILQIGDELQQEFLDDVAGDLLARLRR